MKFKLILGSILALLIGLTVSVPFLLPNFALVNRVNIGVDVAYAYFAIQTFGENITGLWRNVTSNLQPVISYLIVLNVTNFSNQIVTMVDFEVAAAPLIEVGAQNNTGRMNVSKLMGNINASGGGYYVSIENGIVTDFLDVYRYYPYFDQYWSPNSSRLIAFSGMVEVIYPAYAALMSGAIYLLGKAEGRGFGGGVLSTIYDLKYVQLQNFGREFLYNRILSENQTLRIVNKAEVYIETRH